VREAHVSIKPGVQRAQRANPRITEPKNKEPAKRAKDESSLAPHNRIGCRPLRGLVDFCWGCFPGLTPRALCFRALRALSKLNLRPWPSL